MNVTQSYAKPSSATWDDSGLKMSVAAELSRPGVSLSAQIKDSRSYARVMLALYATVTSDLRRKEKDHTAYQTWVQARYLEELDIAQGQFLKRVPGLMDRRDSLRKHLKELDQTIFPLEKKTETSEFYEKRTKYYQWLLKNDKEAWWVLDPVVSVHPDAVVFEVFSIDESSYGRVTVPFEKLDTLGETVFGTTNVDYSRALADEIRRVRSYRPAFLAVESGGVSIATGAGERYEKKIDLPPTWVRGFLQVQSAATFPAAADVTLSPGTLADVLAVLEGQREKESPRSLKFILTPGEFPRIIVEPWGVEIKEFQHRWQGDAAQEIRLWGRRRLMTLIDLLPHADRVDVRLLGTGMPSYWSVTLQGHRFDLGISGWTRNDWSASARFDVLAAVGGASEGDVAAASQILEKRLALTPEELHTASDLTREAATAALQRLCRQGLAMFDLPTGRYRWRQLLPFPAPEEDDESQPSRLAARIVNSGGVTFLKPGEEEDEEEGGGGGFYSTPGEGVTRLRASVRGGESKRERKFTVTLDLDPDGRAKFAACTCAFFRREKLRKGPCAHIVAAIALASRDLIGAKAVATGAAGKVVDFTGKTFVFTGALTLFTREQAESIVEQLGGKASGSVSKNTSYLVAGDKAGSKLAKASELGVPVLTEQQFLDMKEGKA